MNVACHTFFYSQHRLRLLNVAGCNLSTLSELTGLVALEELNASENAIKDLQGVCTALKSMTNLRVLDMRDNEVTCLPKYWDKIVSSTSLLCEYSFPFLGTEATHLK